MAKSPVPPLFSDSFEASPLGLGYLVLPAKGTTYQKAEMSLMLEGPAMYSTKRASNKLGYHSFHLPPWGLQWFPCTNSFLVLGVWPIMSLCSRIFGVNSSQIRRSKRQPWMTCSSSPPENLLLIQFARTSAFIYNTNLLCQNRGKRCS